MRVALVQSYWRRKEAPVYPLGLAGVATALAGRHEVRCLDEALLIERGTDLITELTAWAPEVVGLGMRNADGLAYQDVLLGDVEEAFSPLAHLRDTARRVKEALPGVVVVAGGAAFTIFAGRVMEVAEAVDLGIVGEAEAVFPLLLDRLDVPEEVPGTTYRREGRVVLPSRPVQADVESLPPVDRNLPDVRPYVASGIPWAVGVQSKRGCLLSCAYCVYPYINGRGVRLRRPEDVVDEIEALVHDAGMTRFQFADSVFNQPQAHAEAICRLILERDLRVEWSAWYHIPPLDEDFLRLAVRAGCRVFELSPDSYSDLTLKELRKNIRCRDIDRVCRLARKVPGVHISLDFLIGVPGETLFTALRLLRLLIRLKLFYRKKVSVETINLIRIMPGTPIFHRAVKEGLIPADAELLPLDPLDITNLYYRPRPGGGVERIYHSILRFGALRRRLTAWLHRDR